MSTNESNTYTPVKTRSQNQTTRNSGVKKYPFNSIIMKPIRKKLKTVKKVKNSSNTLILLRRTEKESIIKVEYMYSNILKYFTLLKFL